MYRSGIGLESSLLFASEGANIILADINVVNAEKGAKLIAERFPNVKAIALKTDVSKEADIKVAVDKAVQEFGRLDIMVRIPRAPSSNYLSRMVPVQQCGYYAPRRR